MQLPAKNEFKVEKLLVKVYSDRQKLRTAAAGDTAKLIRNLLNRQEEVVLIFTAAPSQKEFLGGLAQISDLEWSQVVVFLMDEYIGLPEETPQRCGNYLKQIILDTITFKQVYYIDGNAKNLKEECRRYTKLLKEHPVDIACLGIGDNGHITFNEPAQTDFSDPEWVKVVELSDISRQQQVNNQFFEKFEDVPTHAISLTIPALFRARFITCVVPTKIKASAIEQALKGKISSACPASILRSHESAVLYLDLAAATRLHFD